MTELTCTSSVSSMILWHISKKSFIHTQVNRLHTFIQQNKHTNTTLMEGGDLAIKDFSNTRTAAHKLFSDMTSRGYPEKFSFTHTQRSRRHFAQTHFQQHRNLLSVQVSCEQDILLCSHISSSGLVDSGPIQFHPFSLPLPLPLETKVTRVVVEIFPYELGQPFKRPSHHQ